MGRVGGLAPGEEAGVPRVGAQPGRSQPCRRQKEDQVRVMKTMSRKAPEGICFYTLKTKDARSPPLEPELSLLLGRNPREMGERGVVGGGREPL